MLLLLFAIPRRAACGGGVRRVREWRVRTVVERHEGLPQVDATDRLVVPTLKNLSFLAREPLLLAHL